MIQACVVTVNQVVEDPCGCPDEPEFVGAEPLDLFEEAFNKKIQDIYSGLLCAVVIPSTDEELGLSSQEGGMDEEERDFLYKERKYQKKLNGGL